MTPTDTAPPGAASAPPQSSGAGALVRASGSEISAGVFSGIAAFEAAQRMAQCLCSSTMVPTEYRGQQGLANSLIALEIAGRMGLSPLVVMQNMTPIHGRPSWSSSFLIATVNASGRFTPLRFHFDDEENPSWCYAEACDRSSGETLKGEKVSLAMAKREGWWSRKDRHGNETSKWQTMTGQMLRYRAASFWVRVYCPEMSLGLTTQEEALDASAPAAVVETVTVREVPATKGGGNGGAVPQPIRPMPDAAVQQADVVSQEAPMGAEIPSADEQPIKAASPAQPASLTSTDPEPEAEVPPRPKRGPGRPRRAAAVSAEADDAETGAEPAAVDVAAATETVRAASESLTPQLAMEQQLFPTTASTAATPSAAAVAESHNAGAGLSTIAPLAVPEIVESEPEQPAELSAAEIVQTGVQEIPRITSLQALDGAKARVNALLASGRINDDGAERLWAVIDRRRQELQAAPEVEAEAAP